jgi:hypothetical protein
MMNQSKLARTSSTMIMQHQESETGASTALSLTDDERFTRIMVEFIPTGVANSIE